MLRRPTDFLKPPAWLVEGARAQAFVIPTAGGAFAEALAACTILTDHNDCDCYWATGDGAEVYLLHHHAKAMVSIPDRASWQQMLLDLQSRTDVFEDVSGFE
jgi:hypothetical protein